MLVGFRRFLRRRRLTGTVGRGLLGLVVLGLALVFGSKLYYEHRVESFLREAAAQARGLVDLSFGRINADFEGKLHIRNFALRPQGMLGSSAIPLIMDEAVVDFGSYLAMLQTNQRNFPDALSVRFKGIRLEFGAAGNVVSGNPAEALACGDIRDFQAVDLERMGFGEARSDLFLAYRINRIGERITLTMEATTGEAARSSFDLEFDVPGLVTLLRARNPMVGGGDIALESATFVSDAAEFNRRRNVLCAEELGTTPEEAVEANVAAMVALLAEAGYAPDETFISHYRAYLAGEGPWTFSAQPSGTGSLSQFSRVSSFNQLLDRLDVRSAVGDGPRSRFGFERIAPIVPPSDDARPASQALAAVGRWRTIPLGELSQHVGGRVSLATASGKRYVGTVLDVAGGEVVIRARLPGGEATVPLAIDHLREAKVYEIYRPEAESQPEAAAPVDDTGV